MTLQDANASAWSEGVGRWRQAVGALENLAVATTLGGSSVTTERIRAVFCTGRRSMATASTRMNEAPFLTLVLHVSEGAALSPLSDAELHAPFDAVKPIVAAILMP